MDQGFDLIPLAAGQAAADAGHVDGGGEFPRFVGDCHQALFNGWIADRGTFTSSLRAPLTDHVGDPDVFLDIHKLHFAETEIILGAFTVPQALFGFGFRPAFTDCQYEAFAPAAQIIADVCNDLVPLRLRLGGISLQVIDFGHGFGFWSQMVPGRSMLYFLSSFAYSPL